MYQNVLPILRKINLLVYSFMVFSLTGSIANPISDLLFLVDLHYFSVPIAITAVCCTAVIPDLMTEDIDDCVLVMVENPILYVTLLPSTFFTKSFVIFIGITVILLVKNLKIVMTF